MIRLNLIEVAEREFEVDNVSPVNLTNLSDVQRKSKRKALNVFLGMIFLCVAFCCFLSICGVPTALQGIFPAQFLDLIGAEDPSRSALVFGCWSNDDGRWHARSASKWLLWPRPSAVRP
jgi:hypothetical protein